MFYIDFTTPEGKTYRIDVSKNPVTYECPVCGGITIFEFDSGNDCSCAHCMEHREELERIERKKRSDKILVDHINQVFKANITIDDYYLVMAQAETNENAIDEFISALKDNYQKKKKYPVPENNPNVRVIPAKMNKSLS